MTDQGALYLVAGLGRCGLTATMQMLWVGGAPVVGSPPAFEEMQFGMSADPEWIGQQRGRVLKYVDPSVARLPAGMETRTVWLDRDPVEQAKSQAKFVGTLSGQAVSRGDTKRIAKSIRADTPVAIAGLKRFGPVLRIRFRELLAEPSRTAWLISTFFGPGVFPRPDDGARIILPRGPECQPDLDIEYRALRAAGALK